MEIENHLHSFESWMEPSPIPVGEVDIAVVVGTRLFVAPMFQVDAGNNAWGAWLQILGSGDTPVYEVGAKYFDLHRILVTSTERAKVYYMHIGFGTVAAGVLTGRYTTVPFNPINTTGRSVEIPAQARRHPIGTKVWARTICPGQNTATVNFIYGLHEYRA
jgi:hypothetical protein